MLAWTIQAAIESNSVDSVVLSSEDDEIIATALAWGCSVPFRRPFHLANDTASSMDVVMHALEQLPGFEYIILLQPTSPLRTAADIDAAFELLEISGAPSCVSVCEADQSPFWMYQLNEDKTLCSVMSKQTAAIRRQDLPPIYVLNGAIYIAQIDWLRRTKSFITPDTVAYVMNKHNSIDIDTARDFDIFRARIEALN